MKKVIINADDYGYTKFKNEGIIKSHEEGVLTSTTVMINKVSQAAVDKLLKYKKTLGIGLHLNLTNGSPISNLTDVPSLINESGVMFRPQTWERSVWDEFGNRMDSKEIEHEFNLQLDEFKKKMKIMPSHLDSHHFIASHKKIFPVMIKLAKENELPIRLPAWIDGEDKFLLSSDLLRKAKKECKTTENAVFDFFCLKENPVESFIDSLKNLKEGTTEYMFHPSKFSIEDDHTISGKVDLDLLTNRRIKEFIKELEIELINFNQL